MRRHGVAADAPREKKEMSGEELFELMISNMKAMAQLGYIQHTFTMPDGERQVWWRGNGENIIIKYQDDRKKSK